MESYFIIRESSFNMTREGGEDIEGRLWKFLDTWKGGSKKIVGLGGWGSSETLYTSLYTSKPTGGEGGLLKNWTTSEQGR